MGILHIGIEDNDLGIFILEEFFPFRDQRILQGDFPFQGRYVIDDQVAVIHCQGFGKYKSYPAALGIADDHDAVRKDGLLLRFATFPGAA